MVRPLPDSTYGKHLISLIEDEHLHGVGLEEAALDHVVDTTWGTDNDLWTVLESLHVITNAGTTNAGVALDAHEVSDGNHDLLDLLSQLTGWGKDQSLASLDVWVDLLENGDGESSGLSSTRLGLCDDIVTLMLSDFCEMLKPLKYIPLMTGMIARCWIADGRSKP